MKKILSFLIISFLLLGNINISFGEEVCKTEEISNIVNLTYSPDGKSSFYMIIKSIGKVSVIKDGVKHNIYSDINNLEYSPNSKNLIYIGTKDNGNMVLVRNGIEGKEYNDIYNFKYSPDSKEYFYIANPVDGSYPVVVKDGIENNSIDRDYYLEYSPDSKSFAYIFKKSNDNYVIVKDGIESKEYKGIFNFKYSPDSKSFAYIATKDNDKYILVKDGIESKEYDYFSELIYSLNSKSFVYTATKPNGKKVVIKNGVEGKEYDNYIRYLKYLPDGVSISYTIDKGNGVYSTIKEVCNGNTDKVSIIKDNNKIKKTILQLSKQLILSQKELDITNKGKKYIYKIDLISKKLSTQKLEKLMGKLEKIDTSLSKFRKYKNILDYLEAKVGLEINNRSILIIEDTKTILKLQDILSQIEIKNLGIEPLQSILINNEEYNIDGSKYIIGNINFNELGMKYTNYVNNNIYLGTNSKGEYQLMFKFNEDGKEKELIVSYPFKKINKKDSFFKNK